MSLVDRLAAPPARAGITRCILARTQGGMPVEEGKALQVMLDADPEIWPTTAITDALVAEGHRLGREAVRQHRSKRCCCYRKA